MFEVYTKEVKIKVGDKEETYKLRPLTGRYYPKFTSVISHLQKVSSEDSTVDMSKLDPEIFGSIHELCFQTFKKSYPEQKDEVLEEFITQNLFQIIPALIEVNINTIK